MLKVPLYVMLCIITCHCATCAAQQCSVCVYYIYLPLHVESDMLIIANFTRPFKSNGSVRYSGVFFSLWNVRVLFLFIGSPLLYFFFFKSQTATILSSLTSTHRNIWLPSMQDCSKQLCNQYVENIVAILWAAGPCQLNCGYVKYKSSGVKEHWGN